jgi:predicted ATPase
VGDKKIAQMEKLINSISIENFRGFKDKQVLELADPKNITFLIGQNNSGKSLIARLFSIFNKDIHNNNNGHNSFSDKDFSDFDTDKTIRLSFDLNKDHLKTINKPEFLKAYQHFDHISLSFEVIKEKRIMCLVSINDGHSKSHLILEPNQYGNINFEFNAAFIQRYEGLKKEDVERIVQELFSYLKDTFLVFASIRSFDRVSQLSFYKTGLELVEWISQNQDQALIRKAKNEVRRYMTQLNLDEPTGLSADLENKQLVFEFDNGNKLTSDDVGTGYTMIYILLMEMIRSESKIVIIDEIESHLQPGLIKEMIRIVRNINESQFIVSTHSPSAIEAAKENDYLYRFNKANLGCTFEKFYKNNDSAKVLREVCNELGIVPGDALLSNCVIWVEGPSEIFWVRAWMRAYYPIYKRIKKLNFNLIEGLHYSILMTGGNLIAHYSYEESTCAIEDLDEDYTLKVLKVNPNPFVIIDSDNSSVASQKHQRAKRIAKEINEQNRINKNDCFAAINDINMHEIRNFWILKGKELENYCHPEILRLFYGNLSAHVNSTVRGIERVTNWDVYSCDQGVGRILEEKGLENICIDSGAIKHKAGLASFVFQNLSEKHFNVSDDDKCENANPLLNEELNIRLANLFDFILETNGISKKVGK